MVRKFQSMGKEARGDASVEVGVLLRPVRR